MISGSFAPVAFPIVDFLAFVPFALTFKSFQNFNATSLRSTFFTCPLRILRKCAVKCCCIMCCDDFVICC